MSFIKMLIHRMKSGHTGITTMQGFYDGFNYRWYCHQCGFNKKTNKYGNVIN
jgi:hypothetical protein